VFWRVCKQDWGGAGRERKGNSEGELRAGLRVCVCVCVVCACACVMETWARNRVKEVKGRTVAASAFLRSVRRVRDTASIALRSGKRRCRAGIAIR
jgi:hypothetical protein